MECKSAIRIILQARKHQNGRFKTKHYPVITEDKIGAFFNPNRRTI